MKNIYFDLCSIPLYLLILWTCHVRHLTRGRANRTFITMTGMSIFCAVADLWMEFVVNPVPLSPGAVALGSALSYAYKFVRNASLVVYFVYIFRVTRTEYRLKKPWLRLLLWLPNTLLLALLIQNFFTHNVFTVTVEGGYARGPLLSVMYVTAFIYAVAGSAYCVFCRRYLVASKWMALLSIYVLTFMGVMIQLVWPHYAVEMFSTAIGLLLILLLIMRPEETLDGKGLVQGWQAYQETLKRLLNGDARFQIVVAQTLNALEIRSFLGDREFQACVELIANEISSQYDDVRVHMDLFFELPGTFYIVLDSAELDAEQIILQTRAALALRLEKYAARGVRLDTRYCVIRCPDELKDIGDIINLGHNFTQLAGPDTLLSRAPALIELRDYGVVNHMQGVLDRAINGDTLEMYYQPIYDMKAGRFRSAEALARIRDGEYGMISPVLFIPAAEKAGLIVPMGERILESVYRFISRTDMRALGLDYIEINLSVAQCMQRELPETVRRLQEKYHVDPHRINFEVTETIFDNLSGIMDDNLRQLSEMGYTFSLDDYGTGYSNIHRLVKLPLSIIKIDKSLVDDMFTKDGEVIIDSTVHMMQGIHKQLVMEGVETREAVEACGRLSCDYIQGFYYSRPLPEGEFEAFIRAHNGAA